MLTEFFNTAHKNQPEQTDVINAYNLLIKKCDYFFYLAYRNQKLQKKRIDQNTAVNQWSAQLNPNLSDLSQTGILAKKDALTRSVNSTSIHLKQKYAEFRKKQPLDLSIEILDLSEYERLTFEELLHEFEKSNKEREKTDFRSDSFFQILLKTAKCGILLLMRMPYDLIDPRLKEIEEILIREFEHDRLNPLLKEVPNYLQCIAHLRKHALEHLQEERLRHPHAQKT